MARRVPILPDRLKPGLRLVFCGTAAGTQSALEKAYYANRQNKFWRTLHQVGLTPRQFEPSEFPLLWELGIGLTDIAKYHFGMDHQLPRESLGHEAVLALRARIAKASPRHLAFTSLNAGRSVLGKERNRRRTGGRLEARPACGCCRRHLRWRPITGTSPPGASLAGRWPKADARPFFVWSRFRTENR